MGHEKFTIKLIIASRTASYINALSSGFENGQSVIGAQCENNDMMTGNEFTI